MSLMQLQKVFVMNSMAFLKLDTNKDKLDSLKVTFSNSLHPFYLICQVTNA